MIRKPPPPTASVRTARRRKAIRQTLRPAVAPTRSPPEEEAPVPHPLQKEKAGSVSGAGRSFSRPFGQEITC